MNKTHFEKLTQATNIINQL